MKIKRDLPGGHELRSFCTCANGEVLSCSYEYGTVLDGAYTGGPNTNFSLVVRVMGLSDPTGYGMAITRTANLIGRGYPLLQRLGDLVARNATTPGALRVNTVRPTLSVYALEDIGMAVPGSIVDDVLNGIRSIDRVAPGTFHHDTLVYAPVLELCWPKVQLDSRLQTNIRGVFVVGDTGGYVRGLVQAVATGLLAGSSIPQIDR